MYHFLNLWYDLTGIEPSSPRLLVPMGRSLAQWKSGGFFCLFFFAFILLIQKLYFIYLGNLFGSCLLN